jgi:spore maturation protein SpmA
VLNWIWLWLILVAIGYAAFIPGRMAAVGDAVQDGATAAITLVIGLVGGMVFFLGIVRVAFDGGLRDVIARGLAPVIRRLFPEVPPDHPATGAMIMNMASNVFGLGNAATPFGLKAMGELAKLNQHPGVATNAMVLFLAINTSAITLFPPFGTIMIREAANSANPWAIWAPTLFATTCSTLSAVTAYFLLGKLRIFRRQARAGHTSNVSAKATALADEEASAGLTADAPADTAPHAPASLVNRITIAAFGAVLLIALVLEVGRLLPVHGGGGAFRLIVQSWMLPLLIAGLLLIGMAGRVRVYDSMIEGAKEGMQVAVRIVPYLVAILTAVAMFRASGCLDLVIDFLNPYTSAVGVPAEVLPMALLRPLSGSGAFGVMGEIINHHGPDTFIGYLTCTLMGSTETTFYVLALYLGAAGVVDGRHALAACLIGDVGGFIGAVAACHWFFG